MNDILSPSPNALMNLMDDVTKLLIQSQLARMLLCFGSLARGTWDCWPDLDLIVVTDRRSQFVEILDRLGKARPIVHRNHFVAQVEPSGGHVLGILFQGSSVFHCLDLNLLTYQDYEREGSLERLGIIKELYHSSADDIATGQNQLEVPSEQEDPDEARIKWGIHFTKKAAKKVLRGEKSLDDLLEYSMVLRQVMTEYPANLVIGGRQVGYLAHTYLAIADLVLNTQGRESGLSGYIFVNKPWIMMST